MTERTRNCKAIHKKNRRLEQRKKVSNLRECSILKGEFERLQSNRATITAISIRSKALVSRKQKIKEK